VTIAGATTKEIAERSQIGTPLFMKRIFTKLKIRSYLIVSLKIQLQKNASFDKFLTVFAPHGCKASRVTSQEYPQSHDLAM
jgi:hypothetical protein